MAYNGITLTLRNCDISKSPQSCVLSNSLPDYTDRRIQLYAACNRLTARDNRRESPIGKALRSDTVAFYGQSSLPRDEEISALLLPLTLSPVPFIADYGNSDFS